MKRSPCRAGVTAAPARPSCRSGWPSPRRCAAPPARTGTRAPPALELIGPDRRRHAADEGQGADVAGDPVRALLRPRRLGVGVVRRAEHGDEQLDLDDLAAVGVDQAGPLARVVDEELIAGQVLLPHRQVALAQPRPVVLAELAVAVPVGVLLQVLDISRLA